MVLYHLINNQKGRNVNNTPGFGSQSIPQKIYFVGFSTVGKKSAPYTLTNADLIKQDLLNHFNTEMGSRVMMPEYGTRIYSYLFDPFDEFTKSAILEDATNVVNSDPRVELVAIDATQEDQTLLIEISMLIRPDMTAEQMIVAFSIKDKESF